MAVTAVSVMDRLTAPGVRDVESANDAMETALADLDMLVWSLEQAEKVPEGLSEARDAVLRAAERMSEALSLLGIEAL